MLERANRIMLLVLGVALLGSVPAFSQMTVTGTITGAVTDPSGQVIVGSTITLTNDRTGETRGAATNELGAFTFPAIQPSAYSLKVEAAGFKTLQRTGIALSANERLALGDIQLTIGAVTETVTVAAEGAAVQTTTAEHSAQLTPDQLQAMMARGRDVVSLLRLLPGVQYAADSESVGGSFGTGTSMISGASNSVNILAVDGVVSNDLGSPNVFSSVTTLDAIGEVKVLLNGYQAEYAGNGGAVVEVVTRSGGRDFHGTGYGYKRHEMFNANNFFNNRNNVAKPLYRYSTLGFGLGGPIYVPGKFNKNKEWLFGFYNLENWGIKTPGSLQTVTTPTALERAGDFSQTLDVSGKLIPITDPQTGAQFPNNVIPASRINKNGLALMNLLPLPNFTNRSVSNGQYDYVFQEALQQPKRSQLFKVDVVPTPKDRFYIRGKTWLSEQKGYAVAGGGSAWGLFKQCYCFTESGLSVGYTRVFSPTIVMEFTSGLRHNHEAWYPAGGDAELAKVLRSARGFTAGQLHPEINVLGIIPRVTFGGVQSSADVTFDDRFLTGGTDTTFSFNDNVSVIRGSHSFKVGASAYRIREYEGEQSIFSGTFNFGRDVNNPFDSNWAYSNALLGNFQQYQEATARYGANLRQTIAEWYVQDSWKVTRKLSLDYGVRFSWFNQFHPRYDGQAALLALDRYDPKQEPALYRPALDGSGKRMGQNPLTVNSCCRC